VLWLDNTFGPHEFDGWRGYGEITLRSPLGPRTAIDSTMPGLDGMMACGTTLAT
jgi:hypothetical protein